MSGHNVVRLLSKLVAVAGVALFAAPMARGETKVVITSPTRTIPLAPASVGVSGNKTGPAGTIQVDIFLDDGTRKPTGPSLSSGSTSVSGLPISQNWAVTLNSPATQAGVKYVIQASYLNTNVPPQLLDTAWQPVTSQ
jgi:hypothetical protein